MILLDHGRGGAALLEGAWAVHTGWPLAAAGSPTLGLPLDLSRASADDLAALPGLGPALAARIVLDRTAQWAKPAG